MAARDNIGGLLRILAGPGIWFVAFSILYAITTAGCVGLIASAKPIASWVVVLAGIAALAWLAVFGAGRGGGDAFLALMTRLLAIVSLVAALWLLLPLATLQKCTDEPFPLTSKPMNTSTVTLAAQRAAIVGAHPGLFTPRGPPATTASAAWRVGFFRHIIFRRGDSTVNSEAKC
jgi:hypothetical protein